MAFHTKHYQVGDPINREMINEVVSGAAQVGAFQGSHGFQGQGIAALTGPGGAVNYNPWIDPADRWNFANEYSFLGEIMPNGYVPPPREGEEEPPEPPPDYEDERYWVAEVINFTPHDAKQTDPQALSDPETLRLAERFASNGYQLRWTTAVNIMELDGHTHALPAGMRVKVHAMRSPGGRIRYWFSSAATTAAQYVLLTAVDVDLPDVVRGRRVFPTIDPRVWAVTDDEDEEGDGEEEFRTEFGIASVYYKAFEWPDWEELNFRATLLPLITLNGTSLVTEECRTGCETQCEDLEGEEREQCVRECIAGCSEDSPGSLVYVQQKPKWPIPEEPPDLRNWPRTECWLF